MSWLSKFSGSDAKKRNQRKLRSAFQAANDQTAAGVDPAQAFGAIGGDLEDWMRTNNRVNLQTGVKGAGLVAGGATLLGGGGAGGASALNSGVGGQAAQGAAMKSAGASNFLGGIGNFAKSNPELILGAASAFQGSREQAKANEMQKRALALAEQPWNETAGLRKQSLDQMMNPQAPDLSSIYAGTSNPFARQVPPSGFARLRSVGG